MHGNTDAAKTAVKPLPTITYNYASSRKLREQTEFKYKIRVAANKSNGSVFVSVSSIQNINEHSKLKALSVTI